MSASWVAVHARLKPEAPAWTSPAGEVSYAVFDAHIDRIAARLAELPGLHGRIAVKIENPLGHWLAVLALERLGQLSASLPGSGPVDESLAVHLRADVVLCDQPWAAPGAVHLDDGWFRQALTDPRPDLPSRAEAGSDPMRIVLTSGSTGLPRKVLLTRELVEQRSLVFAARFCSGTTRLLASIGPASGAGYIARRAVWIAGGCVAFNVRSIAELPALGVNVVYGAPVQLARMIAAAGEDAQPDPNLRVLAGGSLLSPPLIELIRARLSPDLHNLYGSTEAGLCAEAPAAALQGLAGAVGFAEAGVEIEVVGEERQVRIRSALAVSAYLDDEAASAATFRDGWFHPGDVGSLTAQGLLSIEGRADALLNLGGVKLAPGPIETVLRSAAGVEDVAVFPLADASGVTRAWAAVVRGAAYDEAEAQSRLRAHFPTLELRVVYLDAIPRNETGGLDLAAVRAAVGL